MIKVLVVFFFSSFNVLLDHCALCKLISEFVSFCSKMVSLRKIPQLKKLKVPQKFKCYIKVYGVSFSRSFFVPDYFHLRSRDKLAQILLP